MTSLHTENIQLMAEIREKISHPVERKVVGNLSHYLPGLKATIPNGGFSRRIFGCHQQ